MQSMRKVMIGMKENLAPLFNQMSMMDIPTINGSNLFVGDYKGIAGKIGSVASTEEEWNALWQTLGDKPPGPLPKGAIAVFEVLVEKDRQVTLEPMSVVQNGQDIMIAWERRNISHKEPGAAHPHYTVLLLPEGQLTASFMDSWPIEMERMRIAAVESGIKGLKEGAGRVIDAPERAVFTKKYKNMHASPMAGK